MHAHYKSLKGEIACHGYCPLDLFSGDETRVIRALRSLWNAWVESRGAINNLRIFVQGKAIDPGDVGLASVLTSVAL